MKNSQHSRKPVKASVPTHSQPARTVGLSGKRLAILVACVLGAAGATWAGMELVIWNKIPSELIGKWEVIEGPPAYKDAEFQFFRSGKMVGHMNEKGMERTMNAQVRVEGDKLYITTRRPSPPYDEHVSIETIRTLNDGEFVLVDERGGVIKMARIR